jgi:hypothetical protein
MFALVHQDQLILGPIEFNYRLINFALEEELETSYRVSPVDYDKVPIIFDENTRIISARNQIPPNDPRFNVLKGPIHTINEDEVVFHYTVEEKSLEQIKEEHKSKLPPIRWQKESQLITVTIQEQEIEVSTSRENRLALISKLISTEEPYHFKFNTDTWIQVSKEELQYILNQIDHKVQEAFDWEMQKVIEIDACQTKEEVCEVEITPQIEYEEYYEESNN